MSVFRQHAETVVSEIIDDVCENVLLLNGDDEGEVLIFFILTNNHRLRGYLDAGLLFISEVEKDEVSGELDKGEEFFSVEEICPIGGMVIKNAEKKGEKFVITFENEISIIFSEVDDCTYFSVRQNR